MTDYQKQAEQLYREGRFPEARQQYLSALEQKPYDSQVLLNLGLLALWHNDIEQALNYLHQADGHSGWLGRRWPFSAQVAYRIGSVYYRKDDFVNAAYWYKRAAGPWAIGSFKPLRAIQRQAEAFTDTTPYQVYGPTVTELPFIMLDPLPVVEVTVNGREPYAFFVDTGGADVIIQSGLAQELGLVEYGEIIGSFAANKKSRVGLSKLDTLFFVDTGLADSGFLISQATLDATGITLDWSQAQESSGGGGKIRYLNFVLDQVVLGEGKQSLIKTQVKAARHEADLAMFLGEQEFEVEGLISHDFFKDTTLTMDFEMMRLILQPKKKSK